MVMWMSANEGDILRVEEFLHLYLLEWSKFLGYWEFKPWDKKSRLVFDYPSSLREWKTNFFFMPGDGWETTPSENSKDAPKLLRSWGTPVSSASFIFFVCVCVCVCISVCTCLLLLNLVKFFYMYVGFVCPHLKKMISPSTTKCQGIYWSISDFDELISPQFLFLHFLGPKPSNYVQKEHWGCQKDWAYWSLQISHCLQTPSLSNHLFYLFI